MTKRAIEAVTAPELGSWLGLSEQAVPDLARRGIVVRSGRGRCALKASIRAGCEHQRARVTGHGSTAAMVVQSERAPLAKTQASLVENKARKLSGELVEAAAVEAEWSSVPRSVRAGMLAVRRALRNGYRT